MNASDTFNMSDMRQVLQRSNFKSISKLDYYDFFIGDYEDNLWLDLVNL